MSKNLTVIPDLASVFVKNRDGVTKWKEYRRAQPADDKSMEAFVQRVKTGDAYARNNLEKLMAAQDKLAGTNMISPDDFDLGNNTLNDRAPQEPQSQTAGL